MKVLSTEVTADLATPTGGKVSIKVELEYFPTPQEYQEIARFIREFEELLWVGAKHYVREETKDVDLTGK